MDGDEYYNPFEEHSDTDSSTSTVEQYYDAQSRASVTDSDDSDTTTIGIQKNPAVESAKKLSDDQAVFREASVSETDLGTNPETDSENKPEMNPAAEESANEEHIPIDYDVEEVMRWTKALPPVPNMKPKPTMENEYLDNIIDGLKNCRHHIAFDSNIQETNDLLMCEFEFRCWYHFGRQPMTREDMKKYLRKNKKQIDRRMNWFLYQVSPTIVYFYTRYDMLVTRFYSKLRLLIANPYKNESLDIVLLRKEDDGSGDTYMHLAMHGIKGCFLFEIQDLKDEYMVNPHPRTVMNIQCPFKPLGLAKFVPSGSMFLLTQMGGQLILISLYPVDNFGFDAEKEETLKMKHLDKY